MIFCLFIFSFLLTLALESVKIGVLAKRGSETALQKYEATADYLSERVGMKIKILHDNLEDEVAQIY